MPQRSNGKAAQKRSVHRRMVMLELRSHVPAGEYFWRTIRRPARETPMTLITRGYLRGLSLADDFLHDSPVDIRQAEIASGVAVSEPFMVEA